MSKRNRPIEPEPQATTAAVLDPPESGPPTAEELGQAESKLKEDVDHGSESTAISTEGQQGAEPATPAPAEKEVIRGPDCSTIVANLDRQVAPAWPASSPFKVDWPWGGEPDPVPGDIVGWNWQRGEIAVVTAVPPVTQPWPYAMTVEIRPMAEEWRRVKVFDLNSGQRVQIVWYTRWNRAYAAPGGCVGCESPGSAWLAVVQE